MTDITEREMARILRETDVRIDDETAGRIMARVSARVAQSTPKEQQRDEEWEAFRRTWLTPYGWRYDSPGVYVHEETGAEFHPFDAAVLDGKVTEQWRVINSAGRGPDPNKTHLQRRHRDDTK